MENSKKDIINFMDFFKKEDAPVFKTDFKKEDFDNFFIEEEEPITEEKFVEKKIEKIDKLIKEVDSIKEEVTHILEEVEEEVIEEEEIVEESNDDFYPLYRDKNENFSCDINVEGAKLSETSARLIIETAEWTLMFEGEIDRRGKCVIPIKKLNLFNENTIGKVKLEVNAEGNVFVPWISDCKIKNSKTVSIKMNETKTTPKKSAFSKPGVSVNIRK
jgi:hypothetical protein